jgi:hypothetical protein
MNSILMNFILKAIAWIMAAAVTFATLGPPTYRPHASDLGQNGEHAFAFILVGLCAGCLRGPRNRRRPRLDVQANAANADGNFLTQKSPRAPGPRGSICEMRSSLVDDLDDPARTRLDDHAAFVDDGVVILRVARHRSQHDGVRQRLADDHTLANHD